MISPPSTTQKSSVELFDEHSDQYCEAVRASLPLVGGSVEHFARRKVDVLIRHQPATPAAILDFGCGTGTLSFALAERFPASRIVGIDVSLRSLKIARQGAQVTGLKNLEFLDGDLEKLPSSACNFDLAVAACVFHHIALAERSKWVSAILHSLRPSGTFAMFEHNPLNPLTRSAVNACSFDKDAVLLRAREASSLLRSAGFIRVKIVHYLFLPPKFYPLLGMESMLHWLPIGGQFAVFGQRP